MLNLVEHIGSGLVLLFGTICAPSFAEWCDEASIANYNGHPAGSVSLEFKIRTR